MSILCMATVRLKQLFALSWKRLDAVIFWTPSGNRSFLTRDSRPLYERFQRSVFLFPQLKGVFAVLAVLNLLLMLVYTLGNELEHKCSKLAGPLSQSIFLIFHGVCLAIRWGSPSLFRKLHIIIEFLSLVTLIVTIDTMRSCKIVADLGVLAVVFSSFYTLVVVVYFQYSTLLTVLFALFRFPYPLLTTETANQDGSLKLEVVCT